MGCFGRLWEEAFGQKPFNHVIAFCIPDFFKRFARVSHVRCHAILMPPRPKEIKPRQGASSVAGYFFSGPEGESKLKPYWNRPLQDSRMKSKKMVELLQVIW